MMAGPKVSISPPTRKERKGGIKSVVGEFESAPRLAAAESLQWVSAGCEFPKAAPGLCYVPNPVTGDKTYVGIDTGSGPIFALYQGVKCYLGTGDDPDYDERARALLEAGEARGVEEVLWEYLNTAGGTGPAQTSWVAAIGQMDEAADTLYVGQPVIMMSRFAAVQARAAKAIFGDEETGRLWTANGTPIIASAAASDTVAVVFGWPTVFAGEFVTTRTADLTLNQEMAISERVYGIAVDCEFALHYAVTVAVSDDPPADDPDEDLEILLGSIPSSPIPDGADATIIAQTNVTPDDEVILWYSVNGDPAIEAGQMTQTNPHEFVWEVQGTSTTTGDSVELWALSGTTESNHITIEVT
jgi:hypothetical protein